MPMMRSTVATSGGRTDTRFGSRPAPLAAAMAAQVSSKSSIVHSGPGWAKPTFLNTVLSYPTPQGPRAVGTA